MLWQRLMHRFGAGKTRLAMLDSQENILYVGKAKRLRTRLAPVTRTDMHPTGITNEDDH